MGLFTRRRKESLSPPNVPADWMDGAYLTWEAPRNLIVGESHRQDALVKLAGPPREEGYTTPVCVEFVRDAGNPHDSNAFRAEIDGAHVGFLPREVAAQLAPPLDAFGCSRFKVCGVIRGGWPERPSLGVHVWLDQRLSEGPTITLDPLMALVSWPPRD